MPSIAISQLAAVSAMELASALPLSESVSEMELTDSLLFGCEDEAEEPVAVAAAAPSPCKPVRMDFLNQHSGAAAEVAAGVAAIRSTWNQQAGMLTAEEVARQLALRYAFGDMVRLRTTSAAGKLQVHQSHSFVVCKLWTGEEVMVDVGFRESLQLGCPTAAYERLLEAVPHDFVGTEQTLRSLLRVVCDAASAAFAAHGMLLPPWRTYSSMLHRWTSTSSHDARFNELGLTDLRHLAAGQLAGMAMQRSSSGLTIRPVQSVLAPKHVVVGFPSDAADVQPAPTPCLALPACRGPPPTMKHVSQQIDRLLGPIRKVKLGCA